MGTLKRVKKEPLERLTLCLAKDVVGLYRLASSKRLPISDLVRDAVHQAVRDNKDEIIKACEESA